MHIYCRPVKLCTQLPTTNLAAVSLIADWKSAFFCVLNADYFFGTCLAFNQQSEPVVHWTSNQGDLYSCRVVISIPRLTFNSKPDNHTIRSYRFELLAQLECIFRNIMQLPELSYCKKNDITNLAKSCQYCSITMSYKLRFVDQICYSGQISLPNVIQPDTVIERPRLVWFVYDWTL